MNDVDGRFRTCRRCGEYVQAEQEHDEQCQRDTNARGIARVRAELDRATATPDTTKDT